MLFTPAARIRLPPHRYDMIRGAFAHDIIIIFRCYLRRATRAHIYYYIIMLWYDAMIYFSLHYYYYDIVFRFWYIFSRFSCHAGFLRFSIFRFQCAEEDIQALFLAVIWRRGRRHAAQAFLIFHATLSWYIRRSAFWYTRPPICRFRRYAHYIFMLPFFKIFAVFRHFLSLRDTPFWLFKDIWYVKI